MDTANQSHPRGGRKYRNNPAVQPSGTQLNDIYHRHSTRLGQLLFGYQDIDQEDIWLLAIWTMGSFIDLSLGSTLGSIPVAIEIRCEYLYTVVL